MLLPLLLTLVLLALASPWLFRRWAAGAGWISGGIFLALTVTLFSRGGKVVEGGALTETYSWVPSMGVDLTFYLDGLSLLFALLITGVGALVVLFTGEYLRGDPLAGRFALYLGGFAAAMLGLVLAGNLITLFVFWELTSVTSYLLIGHDHKREGAREAALQALLVTGGGGLALLAGFLLIGSVAGTFDIPLLLARGEMVRDSHLYLPILLLILLGAFTKSAQFPFHFWLPSAMAAPTPASAYLHSVTMVKAGIYLLARLTPMLAGTAAWQWTLVAAGGATMLTGAVMAIGQSDLKRLLAYSTVNALGFLVFLLGIDTETAVYAAFVFLLVHALYKGSLFLVAGAVDHETGTRDVRRLRGVARRMPVVAFAALVSALSMAGFPPLFGFIGKESVYQAVLNAPLAPLLALVAVAANALIFAVAAKATLVPFFGRGGEPSPPHRTPPALAVGPVFLAGGGVVFGLFPELVDRNILSAAVSCVLAVPVRVELALWHGINLNLVLSLITFAAGGLFYAARGRLESWGERTGWLADLGPERWYRGVVGAMVGVARGQTRFLQHGYLSRYLRWTIVTALALAAFTLFQRGAPELSLWPENVQLFELAISLLILAAAVLAAGATTRLAAIVAMGVIGYGVALIYIEFGAPDLAMTQFIIETITVILFVLIIYRLPDFAELSSLRHRVADLVLAAGSGIFMTLLVLAAVSSAPGSRLADFFAEQTYPAAHGRDIVNVILVDFRAMDTLGEIAVLGLAGTGVIALLRRRGKGRSR